MKIVLLDRDGTVVKEPSDNRIDSIDKIELVPGCIEALRNLADNDYSIIFITNQAGISEGKINMKDFERIHLEILERLKPSGVKILKTYSCPHAEKDNCNCRKPKPKMIIQACEDFGLVYEETFMIGDRLSDVFAGHAAGVKTILIGESSSDQHPNYRASDLGDAFQYLVSSS